MTNVHKIEGAHLQCVNNHNVKFEYKGMQTVGVTDYTNQTLPISFQLEKCLNSTALKNKKLLIKFAQNGRCKSSMCQQSLCSV